MNQLTIDHAIAAGGHGMAVSYAKAQSLDSSFRDRATVAILAHLRAVGECSGEDLTEIAKAHGAAPTDDRAFGAVFKRLLSRRIVQVVGYGPRRKGHGCHGAKIYALVREAGLSDGVDYFAARGAADRKNMEAACKTCQTR